MENQKQKNSTDRLRELVGKNNSTPEQRARELAELNRIANLPENQKKMEDFLVSIGQISA